MTPSDIAALRAREIARTAIDRCDHQHYNNAACRGCIEDAARDVLAALSASPPTDSVYITRPRRKPPKPVITDPHDPNCPASDAQAFSGQPWTCTCGAEAPAKEEEPPNR